MSTRSTSNASDDGVLDDAREDSQLGLHLLSPKEAFSKFDLDSSKDIDQDEFYALLEALGIHGNHEYQEKLFRRFTNRKQNTGTIAYEDFKRAWLLLANTRDELLDRGVKLPTLSTRFQLVRLLEKTIDDEELTEKLAEAEASRYAKLESLKKARIFNLEQAKRRAGLELAAALDMAGQVYVLGTGTNDQFLGKPRKEMSSSSYQQVGGQLLQRLWSERVYNTMANDNTSGLWGRSPTRVALTDSTIFVLSGEGLFALGGASSCIDSVAQATAHLPKTTPRSSALLMMNDAMHQIHSEGRHRDEGNADDTKIANVRSVLRYYSNWRPEYDGTKDTRLIENHFLSSVPHDRLFRSLRLRGKPCENSGLSKIDLAGMLARDITLERDVLGELGHEKLAVLDANISDLTCRGKLKTAKSLSLQFVQCWVPLAKEQAKRAKDEELESLCSKQRERAARESCYRGWIKHRNEMRSKPITHDQGLLAGSVTSRGRDIETPRNVEQIKAISGGANHCALLLHDANSSASLYTWGVGSLGRLGHEKSRDLNYPTLVDQLKGVQIADVGGGLSHCAAVSSAGHLYTWGTGTRGQLGFGQLGAEEEEFFCPIPTKLVFPTRALRVSCGNSHTACIGQEGQLYVWGDPDGGRLGLGEDVDNVQYSPVLVDSLAKERVVDVSCGCHQTLVLTATTSVGENTRISVRTSAGGRVYVAGPKHILGQTCPTFRQLDVFEKSSTTVECISAGNHHQAVVTNAGEVYCWGDNRNGCCGQPREMRFVETPTKIALYEAPSNLALGKPSRLSSRYKDASGLSANNAVDGDIDGHSEDKLLAHSQWEANPWFDVDLQSFAHISHIRLWNRTDEPDDCALPLDFFSKRLFPCYIMGGCLTLHVVFLLSFLLTSKSISVSVSFSNQVGWPRMFRCRSRAKCCQDTPYKEQNDVQLECPQIHPWKICASPTGGSFIPPRRPIAGLRVREPILYLSYQLRRGGQVSHGCDDPGDR